MAKDADELKDKTRKALEGAVEVAERNVPEKARPQVAIILPSLIGVVILALMSWGASEIYEAVTERAGLSRLDQPVLDFMVANRQPWITTIVGAFTHIGGTIGSPIIATIVVVALSVRWRSWLPVTLMLAAALGSVTVTIIGKNYIDRVRPPHEFAIAPFESSPSFPSGHALNAVVVGGVIAYLLWRRFDGYRRTRIAVVVLAALYALLMGLSRVYLGHHWLTDVMTGWLLGAAWLALVITTHVVAVAITTRQKDTPALEAHEHPNDDTAEADSTA
ncbi:MAG: phosphatase PAP2 family protein [Propionibacteriaceae bacterium]|nr:phosphatase PAP2 family protein [Propionibacteriaceae bacterium]